jgi:DNA-directed RNA polymerase subunit N (RpoN/RPB10)
MLIPIVCTCGRPIAEIYPAFDARRRKMMAESDRSAIGSAEVGVVETVDLSPIFADYHVTKLCCKAKLISAVDMYELSKKT